jgi:nucleotide-binding universal stress UspA family protein
MIQIKRLLSPIDFSDPSRNALRYAVAFAKQFGAELHLLYVVEPAMYPADLSFGQVGMVDIDSVLEQSAGEEIAKWQKEHVPAEVVSSVSVVHGKPFAEIIAYATANNVDMIVIATHGHSGIDHMLFGSTAEKVIRKSPCPVLTVHATEREFLAE